MGHAGEYGIQQGTGYGRGNQNHLDYHINGDFISMFPHKILDSILRKSCEL